MLKWIQSLQRMCVKKITIMKKKRKRERRVTHRAQCAVQSQIIRSCVYNGFSDFMDMYRARYVDRKPDKHSYETDLLIVPWKISAKFNNFIICYFFPEKRERGGGERERKRVFTGHWEIHWLIRFRFVNHSCIHC